MPKRLHEKRVKELMSRDVVTIGADESVHEALERIAENKVAALPVVDNRQRCIGFLSSSDLIQIAQELESGIDELERSEEFLLGMIIAKIGDGIGHQPVTDVMSETVISVDPDDLVVKAASVMLRERIHRLPVIDNQQHLVGIISTIDILNEFVVNYEAAE
ncbi:MAG: CBS domain-containing protein [bacterium]|nr:CBS domain-containing protein [bacterium]